MAVFSNATTSAVKIKTMERDKLILFIQAFIRLFCETGYPKFLPTNEGSQIVQGCKEMSFDINTAKNKLNRDLSFVSDLCLAGGRNMH